MNKSITYLIAASFLLITKIMAMEAPPKSAANEKMNKKNVKALINATKSNNLENVKELIDAGADVNSDGSFINTNGYRISYTKPLRIAVQYNRMEIVLMLLKAGADINDDTDCGHTALQDAIRINNYEMVKFLLSHGANALELRGGGRPAFNSVCWPDAPKGVYRSIIEMVIERILELPNHDQSKRIITFLCFMRSRFGYGVASLCKNHIMAIVKEENKQLLKDKIGVRERRIPIDSQLAYETITKKSRAFEEMNCIHDEKLRNELFEIYGE